ncbi:MAG: DNA-3-methyladenine glycosylase 2 family protein [Myxococcota bacterium]
MNDALYRRFLTVAETLSPQLVEALETVGPLEPLRPRQGTSLNDALCRSVAGQQLSVRAARTIWGRVMDRASGQALQAFFLDVDPTELRACGLSGAKARAMRSIAEAFASGVLDDDRLRTVEPAERARLLTSVWGVGPWTADMISMFHFGDVDIWPDGDVTARKTLERLTSRRRKTTKTAARFAPHRSYLSIYMWRYADAAPQL